MKQRDDKFDYKKYRTVSKKTIALCKKILNKKNKVLSSIPWVEEYHAKLGPVVFTSKHLLK
jgi:hypothetical protein